VTTTERPVSVPFAWSEEDRVFTRRTLLRSDIAHYLASTGRTFLPTSDQWGYEIAYFVADVVWEDPGIPAMDAHGEVLTRSLTGDVLCGECAAIEGSEDALYTAFQFNGEVGDDDPVQCSDCQALIYVPYRADVEDDGEEE
jgi:hypothetical protein